MTDNTFTVESSTSPQLVHKWPIIAAAVATVVFVVVALAAPYAGAGSARHWFLALASLGFVAVAWLAGARATGYGRWMFAGLLLCLAGDVLGPSNFALGASMFLLAHVLFVVAFCVHGVDYRRSLISLLMLIPSGLLLVWLLPQVEESMRVLVIAYTCVITAMVVSAGGTRRLILIAAVVFYVSDVFVARWRFVDHDSINALFCYPLYYTACLLLAFSIRSVALSASRTTRHA